MRAIDLKNREIKITVNKNFNIFLVYCLGSLSF